MRMRKHGYGWIVGLSLMLCCVGAAWAKAPTIAAASDLKFAVEEIAAKFSDDTGREVSLVFGSSGNFYRQIMQGAPFQMFLSADQDFVFKLAEAGKTLDRGVLYAIGRIVLIVPHGSSLRPDGRLEDLAAALADGRVKKFAIANPAHAPYGQRAEEVLQRAGLWAQIEDKLVIGEDVSQATQFATSGSAEGGIIAYSLALAPALAKLGNFALIPEAWHTPLKQRMVLLKGAEATAQIFYRYLQQPAARKIMQKYGFALPGEP